MALSSEDIIRAAIRQQQKRQRRLTRQDIREFFRELKARKRQTKTALLGKSVNATLGALSVFLLLFVCEVLQWV